MNSQTVSKKHKVEDSLPNLRPAAEPRLQRGHPRRMHMWVDGTELRIWK